MHLFVPCLARNVRLWLIADIGLTVCCLGGALMALPIFALVCCWEDLAVAIGKVASQNWPVWGQYCLSFSLRSGEWANILKMTIWSRLLAQGSNGIYLASTWQRSVSLQPFVLGTTVWPGWASKFGAMKLDSVSKRNVEKCGVFVTMHFVFPQLVHHRIDSEVQPKPAVKTRLINQFLLSMYIKAGGMLPERWLGLAKATIIYFYCGRIRESLISLVPFFLQRQVSSWRKAQEEPSTETHCYLGWWVPATWRKREPLSFCRW